MKIEANLTHFKELNQMVRECPDKDIVIDNCIGQRYIASGLANKNITINGTPGNALGAYLDGCRIVLNGNAQEATGDTMNDGTIVIHGSCGDGTGYAMRGGKIFIHGNSGYRTGIHMKAFKEKFPVIVIGGSAGSFLGEYQAGGVIIVLGMNTNEEHLAGYFCGTGMHGGKMFFRCDEDKLPPNLPPQVDSSVATAEDLAEIEQYIDEYCKEFGENKEEILNHKFYVLKPDTKNPYKQLYTYSF